MLLCCALMMQSMSLWSALSESTSQQHCHTVSEQIERSAHQQQMDISHHCLMWCMGTAAHSAMGWVLTFVISPDHLMFQPFRPALVAWQTAPPIRPPI
jgi:hypothetical protein